MVMAKILIALVDLLNAFERINLAFMLGWQDIKQRYRRSKLGPFWLTISMGVMISMIGLIFGQALSLPRSDYLPFLASGIIFWTFISTTVIDGSTCFIHSAGMIRQLALPLSLYIMRILWRNVIILGHNLIIFPVVLVLSEKTLNLNLMWLVPGFLLLLLNVFWVSLFLGVCCTRFRDLPPIITSLTQVFFYFTPIIWMPGALTLRANSLIVEPNPVYHLLELVRGPLLGYCPSTVSWCVGLTVGVLGSLFTLVFFGVYKKRIAYWI